MFDISEPLTEEERKGSHGAILHEIQTGIEVLSTCLLSCVLPT